MNKAESTATRRNYPRRLAGLLICFAVPALCIVSFISGMDIPNREWFVGSWPLYFSVLITAVNLHTSFGRALIHRLRKRPDNEFKYVSGIPVIGWIGQVAALYFGWAAPGTALIGFVLCFLDTGGLVWFLIATWRDTSAWDEPYQPSKVITVIHPNPAQSNPPPANETHNPLP